MPSRNSVTVAEPVPGPRALIGVRNLVRFARDPLGEMARLKVSYGDIVRLKAPYATFYLLSLPADIESALVDNAKHMLRDRYVSTLRNLLGDGLLCSEGELWKRQRKLMASAFTPKRIAKYADVMAEVSEKTVSRWTEGTEYSLAEEMSRITMALVCEVLFGTGISDADLQGTRHAMEAITEYLSTSPEALLEVPMWTPTPRMFRVRKAVADLDSLVYRMIARRKKQPDGDDLLSTLIKAVDESGTSMTDEQLRDEVITLFLAGHETTALALGYTFYLLGKHPEVVTKLQTELSEVVGERRVNASDVRNLKYTMQVLKESMRLFPPAWAVGREAGTDVEIGGHRIPKGSQILASPWIVHRDARWFPNPNTFDPSRFAEPDPKRPRFAYFPFGGGPRVCIGNHFAMTEAVIVVAAIMQRFELDVDQVERLELEPAVTLRVKSPDVKFRVRRRPAA